MLSRNNLTLKSLTSKIGTDNGTGLNRLTDKRDSKVKEKALFSVTLMYEVTPSENITITLPDIST